MPIKLIPPRKGKTPYFAGRGTYLGVRVDRSTKASKRAVALKVIAQWERDIESGCFAVEGEQTFASSAAAYMRAGGERKYLKKLLEHFGDTPISRIDQSAIEGAAVALYPDQGAATRNRSVFTPISAILRHNGYRGLGIRRPKGSAGNSATFWLWPEQAQAIFAEAEKLNPRFAALLIVLCYTGMRLSEALSLTWDQVRLADGYAYLPDTKNDTPRPVFVPPVAVAALANIERSRNPSGRVFRLTKSGHIYNLHKVTLFKAGVSLPKRSNFHVYRHTFLTWMRRYAGLDDTGLLAIGTHKDRKSLARYTHAVVSEESRRAELLPTEKLRKTADDK
jgi:integrase